MKASFRRAAFVLAGLAFTRVAGAEPPAKGAPPAGSTRPAPAPSGGAPATSAFAVEVLVLHATNGEKGIDPRIGDMKELGRPPFSSYKSYELLQKVRLPLQKDDPKTVDLPNQRVLQTKLLDMLPDDTVRLSASINQPGGKTFLPLLEVKAKVGQPFIVAGQSYHGGILVLVLRVLK